MNYDELNEQQRAASQALAEIVADLGVGFALQSLGQTCAQIAQSEDGARAEALSQAAGILHQLADLLGEENE